MLQRSMHRRANPDTRFQASQASRYPSRLLATTGASRIPTNEGVTTMSRMSTNLSRAVPLGIALAVLFCAPVSAQNTLTAVKVAQAPKLEALAADPAWAKASELKFSIKNGQNFANGNSSVAMKAVYTSDMLYMLVQYADPTQSVRRSPYVKQSDGSWKKLSDPDDKG